MDLTRAPLVGARVPGQAAIRVRTTRRDTRCSSTPGDAPDGHGLAGWARSGPPRQRPAGGVPGAAVRGGDSQRPGRPDMAARAAEPVTEAKPGTRGQTTPEADQPSVPASSVRATWDVPLTLLGNDIDEVERQLERLRNENDALQRALETSQKRLLDTHRLVEKAQGIAVDEGLAAQQAKAGAAGSLHPQAAIKAAVQLSGAPSTTKQEQHGQRHNAPANAPTVRPPQRRSQPPPPVRTSHPASPPPRHAAGNVPPPASPPRNASAAPPAAAARAAAPAAPPRAAPTVQVPKQVPAAAPAPGRVPPAPPAARPKAVDPALVARREALQLRYKQREDFPRTATTPMDIVFVSAEVAPYSKTGGLGDVVGSLPQALAERGHRVMVVAPRYMHGTKADERYAAAKDTGTRTTLDLYGGGQHEVGFFHEHRDNVDWVFVDHSVYHREGTPYCDASGKAFGDNVFRYSLLSLAACEAPLCLNIGGYRSGQAPGFPYGDNCVFVANDWHAALVPTYLAARYRRHGVYNSSRTIFAIHNLSHQGVEPSDIYGTLGLPDDCYDRAVSWEFPSWAHITGPAVNLLKGALVASDRLVTVSNGYAWEVTTPEGGWGLHELLKSRGHVLNGITNGIDMDEWDPANDPHLEQPFSAEDLSGKAACKAALQKELGFPVDPNVPLLGFIGRLDHQKGPDLMLDAIEQLSHKNVQIVMLGSGVEEYENRMRECEDRYKHCFRGWVGFSVPVAHRILAGSDLLIMPSRFEPCGLNQLFAMRYGTLPLAHSTGGLRDTIDDFNAFAADRTQCGTGWTFGPPEVDPMMRTIDGALNVYRGQKDLWLDMQLNGMCKDLSWAKAAVQYEEIFGWAKIDNAVFPN